jgi:hypothetical protein
MGQEYIYQRNGVYSQKGGYTKQIKQKMSIASGKTK